MAEKTKIRHQSIITYVANGTTIFNTIFLILHICFGLFFHANNAMIMLYYNYISIAIYLIGYVLIYKELANPYSVIANVEVYIFMLLAVYCLGWDYGFQQYCIIFVVSLMFTDFFTNQQHHLNKLTIALIAINVITYLGLRIFTFNVAPIYILESKTPAHLFFIGNSIIAFTFLIAYSFMYSQTVFRLEKSLVEVATKDALTGLYNRRKMQDILHAMSEILSASGHQICIAIVDIDNFKSINDTYGHNAGDEVLRTIANIFLNIQKESENFNACRWGGEEFLIFYRNRSENQDEAFKEFDNLRKQIEDATVTYDNHKIHFTATIGLTFYQENCTIADMIKRADEHLYYGKEHGKNVVIRD